MMHSDHQRKFVCPFGFAAFRKVIAEQGNGWAEIIKGILNPYTQVMEYSSQHIFGMVIGRGIHQEAKCNYAMDMLPVAFQAGSMPGRKPLQYQREQTIG